MFDFKTLRTNIGRRLILDHVSILSNVTHIMALQKYSYVVVTMTCDGTTAQALGQGTAIVDMALS